MFKILQCAQRYLFDSLERASLPKRQATSTRVEPYPDLSPVIQPRRLVKGTLIGFHYYRADARYETALRAGKTFELSFEKPKEP